ncbi:MAG: acyl-CoA/acyl-ACP dehydrogenase [Deltaproteobacteria bacterium]|nr:acyl-CoA/acyl-ACP dehydrogenase [Deltaproteobacteria bacterium]
MDFAFSEEQDAFREMLRRFFEEKCPTTEVFRLMETDAGYDPGVWKQMGEELGLQGLLIPEEYGGQGFGFLELGIALEEMGRVLLPSPFYASACLAANAILAAGDEAQKSELLPGIASGETLASLALLDAGGQWDPASLRMEARPDADAFVLEGEKTCVVNGATADLLVVAARLPSSTGDEGLCLLTVRSDDAGVTAEPMATLDATRKQARLHLHGARARCLGEPGAAAGALHQTLDRAAIALAAEMAGGADRCLQMSVEYAQQRSQFARPIGSFQAIKHKCAEVLLEVELARSAAWWACWTAAEDNAERGEAAHLAKACCADAYLQAAAENIQIHGGIGFTWEAAPHLYYRRAKVSQTLFGDSVHHRRRLVDGLGIGA